MEAGLTAKSSNTETIVKQMRPVAHMAVTCGTTFTDALSNMVERKPVIALYTMRCFGGMQPEMCMQLQGLAEEYSTKLREASEEAAR